MPTKAAQSEIMLTGVRERMVIWLSVVFTQAGLSS